MIIVNKPSNFYWEYIAYIQVDTSGVITINYYKNNTLGNITITRNGVGDYNVNASPSIFFQFKTFVFISPDKPMDNVSTNFIFSNDNQSTCNILAYKNGTIATDGFGCQISIRIYP
jgi:hypothetical protein